MSNNTTTSLAEDMTYPPYAIVFFVTEAITFLLIIIINSMVLGMLLTKSNKHLRMKYLYLVHLSFTDLLVGLANTTFAIVAEVFKLPNTFYACIFINSVLNLLTSVSILSLCMIAVRSLITVRYRHLRKYSRKTWCNCAVITAIWLVAGLENILLNFLWHEPVERFQSGGCTYRNVIKIEWSVFVIFFGFYVVAMVAMLVMYFLIYQTYRRSAQTVASHSNTRVNEVGQSVRPGVPSTRITKDRKRSRKSNRLARSVKVIFLVFAITFLPIHLVNFLTYLIPDIVEAWGLTLYLSLTYIAVVCSHLNSFVNALVYCLGCQELRKRFLDKYPFVERLLLGLRRCGCSLRRSRQQAEPEVAPDFVRPVSASNPDLRVSTIEVCESATEMRESTADMSTTDMSTTDMQESTT